MNMAEFQSPFFTSTSEDVEAEYIYGVEALRIGDHNTASRHFSNAAQGGHISALFNLSLLWGGGNVTPYDFDLAADCWYKAADAGHPSAKSTLWQLEAADRGGFGSDNLVRFINEANVGDNLLCTIMICAARFYDVVCRKYGAAVDVISYELDLAAKSNFGFVHSFINRTGINHEFYAGSLGRLKPDSAADQIVDGLNKLHIAMKHSGVNDRLATMARCSIVGYIIAKSPYGEHSQPLLGIDTFFDENEDVREEGSYAKGKRLFELGMQHALIYECEKAIEFYTESIGICPNPAPYINRANILAKRLRYSEALDDLLEAQCLDKKQGNEFEGELLREITRTKFILQNYHNGMREKLISDFQKNDSGTVSTKVFCSSFQIPYIQWEYRAFNRKLAEYHFFNDIDNIIKFDDLSLYPEVEGYKILYSPDFIEMKVGQCPDNNAYTKAEITLHSFLCCYDVSDMRELRRRILHEIHENLLAMDFGDFYNTLSSPCRGIIREAEDFNK